MPPRKNPKRLNSISSPSVRLWKKRMDVINSCQTLSFLRLALSDRGWRKFQHVEEEVVSSFPTVLLRIVFEYAQCSELLSRMIGLLEIRHISDEDNDIPFAMTQLLHNDDHQQYVMTLVKGNGNPRYFFGQRLICKKNRRESRTWEPHDIDLGWCPSPYTATNIEAALNRAIEQGASFTLDVEEDDDGLPQASSCQKRDKRDYWEKDESRTEHLRSTV